jgi:hypothetical protein
MPGFGALVVVNHGSAQPALSHLNSSTQGDHVRALSTDSDRSFCRPSSSRTFAIWTAIVFPCLSTSIWALPILMSSDGISYLASVERFSNSMYILFHRSSSFHKLQSHKAGLQYTLIRRIDHSHETTWLLPAADSPSSSIGLPITKRR